MERVNRYPDAGDAVGTWLSIMRAGNWQRGQEMIGAFSGRVRPIENGRVVFDIKGNSYRLVCAVRFPEPGHEGRSTALFKFFGTHAEYDKIDAATVEPT